MNEAELFPPSSALEASAQPTLFPDTAPPSLLQLIEAVLFVAGEPLTIEQLARALEVPPEQVAAALVELSASYTQRGIRLQRHGNQVMLVSAPEAAPVIRRFLGAQPVQRLSRAALETLAIIAYRQPITRAQIDAIRGVDSSAALRALLARDLICEVGRLETLGRPVLYATTPAFLQQFGLTSLADLPPVDLPE
ncbi:MAG: SMC-Scp complex subunit ScpB [Chloroflexus sp.]